MKSIKLSKSKSFIALAISTSLIVFSFNIKGDDPIASNSKIVHGNTAAAASKKDFNSGEEIYVYIPLKTPLSKQVFIRLEVDGESVHAKDLIAYEKEQGLTYYSFALAIDPKNHNPERYFYKEGQYANTTSLLSKLTPGKHKLTFGLSTSYTSAYTEKISITVNVTAEGAQTWATWATELKAMDEEYGKKLEQ